MEQSAASLFAFFPASERIIPPFNTSDYWVVANNTNFSTQLIDCGYSISGAYSRAPRWIYYILTILAVVIRRHEWIEGAVMTYVMMYSSVASVHALALVCIRYQLFASGPEFVTVDLSTNLKLPVWPSAWDNDCDGVLSAVGASFLILAPMQTYSSIFKHASADIKALLFMWGLLLLVGMIAALVNEEYIGVWSFPQLRFCPPGYNDTLPFASTGPSMLNGSWNQTVWGTIRNLSTITYSTSCLYPCFNTAWSLKDSGELLAISRYKTDPTNTMAAWIVNIIVYILITTSGLCTLTVFFMQFFGYKPLQIFPRHDVKRVLGITDYLRWSTIQKLVTLPVNFVHRLSKDRSTKIPKIRQDSKRSAVITICFTIGSLYLKVIDIYARVMSPIAFVIFIAWIEWCITTDIEGETFRHIGQWGSLVAAILALLAAMIIRYNNEVAQRIKNRVISARPCKATSMKGIIIERPPALDTDDSETEKLATVQIKGDEV
jgi:hypothetical protein